MNGMTTSLKLRALAAHLRDYFSDGDFDMSTFFSSGASMFLGVTVEDARELFFTGMDEDRYAKAAELERLADKYEAAEIAVEMRLAR